MSEAAITQRGIEQGWLRTARKPWTCIQCGAPISPGDRYFEDISMAEPRYGATGDRFCLVCAEDHGTVRR